MGQWGGMGEESRAGEGGEWGREKVRKGRGGEKWAR